MLIRWLLNIAYVTVLTVASPILLYKMLVKGKYFRTFGQRLGFVSLQQADVWVHGVSVGEIKAALPLVKKIAEHTDKIVISSTSSRGLEMAKSLYSDYQVVSFPLDFSWAVTKYLRCIQPKLIVLMELELWPNFLLLADRAKVPVVLVNGRLSQRSGDGYYRYLRWGFARATRAIQMFCMQNDLYAERLLRLKVPKERVVVTGNIKFDAASEIPPLSLEMQGNLKPDPENIVIVAGSTHWPEEKWIFEAYQKVRDQFPVQLIIVPRHPERATELAKFLREQGTKAVRKSQLNGPIEADSIIIGDVMGELAQTYTIADFVCIGGSFIAHGGQNFIEPASLGKVVICGPFMSNFPDIQYFLEQQAAIQVESHEYLHSTLTELMSSKKHQEIGVRAKELVEKNKGCVDKNLRICMDFFKKS